MSQTANVLARLRQKAQADNRNYLTQGHTPNDATMQALACPQCGATRAHDRELTTCSHCGHLFLQHELSDGVYLKKRE
jgi:predicted amidophosphoribosyltransferase